MQVTAGLCLVVIHLTILCMPTAGTPTLQRGQFRELSISVDDTATDEPRVAGTGGEHPVASRGKVKPVRPGTHRRGNSAVPRSEPTAYRHDSSHCKNGGTGFLKTFCFCQSEYTGRYCEHRMNRSCNAIEHGGMIYRNCSSCLCTDGVLDCRLHELEGCRDIPVPDYRVDGLALEEELHNSACVSHASMQGLVTSLVFAIIHRILWLQNTSLR